MPILIFPVTVTVEDDVLTRLAEVQDALFLAPLSAKNLFPLHERHIASETKHPVRLDLAAGGIVGFVIPKSNTERVELKITLPATGESLLDLFRYVLNRDCSAIEQRCLLADLTDYSEAIVSR